MIFGKELLCRSRFDFSNNQTDFHTVGRMKNQMHMFRHNDITKYFELVLLASNLKKINQDFLGSVIGKAWQVAVTIERYKTSSIEIIKVLQSGHGRL